MKSLIHFIAGTIVCLAIGSTVLIARIPLRRSSRREFGPIDQVFALIIIGIGMVYAILAVRRYLAWRDEHRPRRRKKRRD